MARSGRSFPFNRYNRGLGIRGAQQTATLTAALGGLTSTLTETPTVGLTLSAPLGGLTSAFAATPKVTLTLTASLGGLTSTLAATPTVALTFTAPLGRLTASLTVTDTEPATLTAALGGLTSTAAYTASAAGLGDAAEGTLQRPHQFFYGFAYTLTLVTTTVDSQVGSRTETVSADCGFETRTRLASRCVTRTDLEHRAVNPRLEGRAVKRARDPDEELALLAAFLTSN